MGCVPRAPKRTKLAPEPDLQQVEGSPEEVSRLGTETAPTVCQHLLAPMAVVTSSQPQGSRVAGPVLLPAPDSRSRAEEHEKGRKELALGEPMGVSREHELKSHLGTMVFSYLEPAPYKARLVLRGGLCFPLYLFIYLFPSLLIS